MKLTTIVLALAAGSIGVAGPAAAQDPSTTLSLEHRMLLRCSAAFALVAHGQDNANAEALAYPPMGEAGREFFVRATARVMDEAGLDRDAVSRQLSEEAQAIRDNDELARLMPACLGLMDGGDSQKSR